MRFFKMAVAIDQNHGFKPFNRSQRCRLQSFTQFDYNILELSHTNLTHSLKQAIEVASIHRSFSTPCFSLSSRVDQEEFDNNPKVEIVGGRGTPKVRAFVVEIGIALASGVDPLPLSSGLGGAYLLRSWKGGNIAIAKPIDEEPLAFNNPKGFGGLMLGQPGMKRSIRVGETGIRELAAYLLDHGGFAGVPSTALVKIFHFGFHANDAAMISAPPSKVASVQRFIDHDFDAGELGLSCFSVASVHRIGIFDIRLLNLDRHAGNILVKKNDQNGNYAAELVPIDHGLCLPEWLDDPYFEWMHWPQASVPFSESECEYISNLDPFKDAELLRTEVPCLRESSIRVLIVCTIFLKRAAAAGLCLAVIGEMMTREFHGGEENMSVLESLCAQAKEHMVALSNEDGNDQEQNVQRKEKEEDIDIFCFDDGSEVPSNQVINLPQLLQCPPNIGKPPKISRFSSVRSMPGLHDEALSPLYEENDYWDDACNRENIEDNDDSTSEDDSKLCGLTKSMSFSVQNYNGETAEVSLGDLSPSEWELFLGCLEKLLPEAFEGTKCMGLKQRLGTSCKF